MADGKIKIPFSHKALSASVVAMALVCLVITGFGGFFGFQLYQRETKRDQIIEQVVSNLRVINEQAIVRQIIEDKVGDALPGETKSRIAFEIIDMCRRNRIPLHIALAIPEVESTWNPHARNGVAFGLYQVTIETSMPLFRESRETFSEEKLLDPIRNTNYGLQTLVDKHDAAVAAEKSPSDDWTRALWLYNGRGETYARKVLERSVTYKKILDSPLQGMDKLLAQPQVPTVITVLSGEKK